MNQSAKSAVCFGVGSLVKQVKPRRVGRSQNTLHEGSDEVSAVGY